MLGVVVVEALVPASETAQAVEMIVIPVQGQVYMLQTPAAGETSGSCPAPKGCFSWTIRSRD